MDGVLVMFALLTWAVLVVVTALWRATCATRGQDTSTVTISTPTVTTPPAPPASHPQLALQQAMQQVVDDAEADRSVPHDLLVTYSDGVSRSDPRPLHSGLLVVGDITVLDDGSEYGQMAIKYAEEGVRPYYMRQGCGRGGTKKKIGPHGVERHAMTSEEMAARIAGTWDSKAKDATAK